MDKKLLVIELDDEGSVPRVIYKGEEIIGKTHVKFEWRTRKEDPRSGGLLIELEHVGGESSLSLSRNVIKTGNFPPDNNNPDEGSTNIDAMMHVERIAKAFKLLYGDKA